jgi:hypothetical protein
MNPQILVDDKGNETGVFIPMAEWNRIKKQLSDVEDGFVLTDEHIAILDKASAEPLSNCMDAKLYIQEVKEKYGL